MIIYLFNLLYFVLFMVKSNLTSKKQEKDQNQGYQKVATKENIPNVSNVLIVGEFNPFDKLD